MGLGDRMGSSDVTTYGGPTGSGKHFGGPTGCGGLWRPHWMRRPSRERCARGTWFPR